MALHVFYLDTLEKRKYYTVEKVFSDTRRYRMDKGAL